MFAFPMVFVSHGAPTIALDRGEYSRRLGALSGFWPRPNAIVSISAHWETPAPVRVDAAVRHATLHDFSGFPDELYRLDYPAPGAPELAADILGLLSGGGIAAALFTDRGLDHGTWIPLRFLYPAADVPVVPISLPRPRTPETLAAIGRALAPLRERGVLLLGSGGVVHNLRMLEWDAPAGSAQAWARDFDAWVAAALRERRVEDLLDFARRAPQAQRAAPTTEHLDPLLVLAGALREADRVRLAYEGFDMGTLSLACFEFA